jgi:hypothetical protein
MSTIRPVSIHATSGKKVATIQTGDLNTTNAGELEFGDGGVVLGRTSGAIKNDFTCDTIILFEGNPESQRWAEDLESGKPQKIQFNSIDGKLEQGTYFVTARKVSWDHKTGKMSGNFSFEGGANSRS